MTTAAFYEVAQTACRCLEEVSRDDPRRIAACKTGEDFEACVVDAVGAALGVLGLSAVVHYNPGSHGFPDIVVEFPGGERYGIEVKSSSAASSRGWKINGNSILGSTKEAVLDTYLIFGKTAPGHQAFRCKRYEEAVANVAVTHSPRYAIDMDVAPGETFFAKSGLSYRQISEDPNPIGLVTGYFKTKGQRAWWLAESTPAAIRMFSDLSSTEQSELVGYCFAHFPEVFSPSPQKFRRSAMWLMTDRSVVSPSLRDSFTAGGRCCTVVNGGSYENLPRIFGNLHIHREAVRRALENAPADVLREDWGYSLELADTGAARCRAWIAVTAQQISRAWVNGYDPVALLSGLIRA